MLLFRHELGAALRRRRTDQRRTLRDVARHAGVSLGYLSEVERGVKEASSELLAAICDALDVALADVLVDVAGALSRVEATSRGTRPVTVAAPALVPAAVPARDVSCVAA